MTVARRALRVTRVVARRLFAECEAWIGRVRTLAVETHDGHTVDDVAAAVEGAGAQPELRELQLYAEFGNEVGVFARRAAQAAA